MSIQPYANGCYGCDPASAGMVLSVNGEWAQLICLAGHGSAWLAGGGGQEPPALDRENSTFRYAGSVSFRFGGPTGAGSRAGRLAGWPAQLAGRGARRIWLVLPGICPAADCLRSGDEPEATGALSLHLPIGVRARRRA